MFGNILELFSHAGYMNERKQFHIEILSLFRSQHFFLYVGGIWFLFGWLFRLVCFIKYIFRQCLFEVAAQPIDFIETAFCILQGFLSGLFFQIVEFDQLVFCSYSLPPEVIVAVIVASPLDLAVTIQFSPSGETVATSSFDDCHLIT